MVKNSNGYIFNSIRFQLTIWKNIDDYKDKFLQDWEWGMDLLITE